MFLYYTRALALSLLTLTGSLVYSAQQQPFQQFQQPGRLTPQESLRLTDLSYRQFLRPEERSELTVLQRKQQGLPLQPPAQQAGQPPIYTPPARGMGMMPIAAPGRQPYTQQPGQQPGVPAIYNPQGQVQPTVQGKSITLLIAKDASGNPAVLLTHKKGTNWSGLKTEDTRDIQTIFNLSSLPPAQIINVTGPDNKPLSIAITPVPFITEEDLRKQINPQAGINIDDVMWKPVKEITGSTTSLSFPLLSAIAKTNAGPSVGKVSLEALTSNAVKAAASKIEEAIKQGLTGTPVQTPTQYPYARPGFQGQPLVQGQPLFGPIGQGQQGYPSYPYGQQRPY